MNNVFEKLKDNIKTINNFKLLVVVVLFFNIAIGINVKSVTALTYFQNFIMNIQNPFYNICVFLVLVYVSISTMHCCDENYPMIGRFVDRIKYLEMLLKQVTFNVILIFALNMIISLAVLLIFFEGYHAINPYYTYSISEPAYLIFYVVRTALVMNLLVVITILIGKLYNKILRIITVALIAISFLFIITNVIDGFSLALFLPSNYISPIAYPSFANEALYSSAYLIILLILITVLNYFIEKKKIDIG